MFPIDAGGGQDGNRIFGIARDPHVLNVETKLRKIFEQEDDDADGHGFAGVAKRALPVAPHVDRRGGQAQDTARQDGVLKGRYVRFHTAIDLDAKFLFIISFKPKFVFHVDGVETPIKSAHAVTRGTVVNSWISTRTEYRSGQA